MKKIILMLLLVGCVPQTPQSENSEYEAVRGSMQHNLTCVEGGNYGCMCCNNRGVDECYIGQNSSFFSMSCPLAKELGIRVLRK